jgi:hypothetical protein
VQCVDDRYLLLRDIGISLVGVSLSDLLEENKRVNSFNLPCGERIPVPVQYVSS